MLSKKQEECIMLLSLKTMTKQEIADRVGCSRQIIYDWLKQDKFKAELDKALLEFKNTAVKDTQTLLAKTLGQAVQNVIDIANDKNEDTTVRLKANEYLINKIFPDAKPIQEANDIKVPAKVDNINEIQKRIKEKLAKKCV